MKNKKNAKEIKFPTSLNASGQEALRKHNEEAKNRSSEEGMRAAMRAHKDALPGTIINFPEPQQLLRAKKQEVCDQRLINLRRGLHIFTGSDDRYL